MEDKHQAASGQSNPASGDDKKDSVAFETHKKLLGEMKTERDARRKLESDLELIKNEKLSAEGKKDELIASLTAQNKEKDKAIHERDVNFGYSKLEATVREKALKHGCKDPAAFLKLVSAEELNTVAIDDNYNVDGDTVEKLIERNKSSLDYLFGKPTPVIDDNTPGKDNFKPAKVDLSKKSHEEIMAMAREMQKKK